MRMLGFRADASESDREPSVRVGTLGSQAIAIGSKPENPIMFRVNFPAFYRPVFTSLLATYRCTPAPNMV